jgi:hypothetical protein
MSGQLAMKISLIVPTRNRKEQFFRMVKSAIATAGCDIEIVSGSNGDDEYTNYNYQIDTPTAFMWEHLYKKSTGDLIMLCSDDVIFSTPLWGKALLDSYEGLDKKIHVWHLQDSRDINGTPHPIVSREWVNALGYFVPPIFLHWYVDTWIIEIAKANNCFTHLKDYLLIHDKPSDIGKADKTHTRIRNNWWQKRDGYVNSSCGHFLDLEKNRMKAFI